jgi:hypothetical protein
MTDTSAMRNAAEMAAASERATELIRNAMQATQEYNAKIMEFALANCDATFQYLSQLSGTKAPSDFIEITTRHVREQTDMLTRQAKELSELAQKFLPKFSDIKIS